MDVLKTQDVLADQAIEVLPSPSSRVSVGCSQPRLGKPATQEVVVKTSLLTGPFGLGRSQREQPVVKVTPRQAVPGLLEGLQTGTPGNSLKLQFIAELSRQVRNGLRFL